MKLRPDALNRFFDWLEPDAWGHHDWWSWLSHRLLALVAAEPCYWIGMALGAPWLLWAVAVTAMALVYAHDEGAVRGFWPWSEREPNTPPFLWDGLLDIPAELVVLVWWLFTLHGG